VLKWRHFAGVKYNLRKALGLTRHACSPVCRIWSHAGRAAGLKETKHFKWDRGGRGLGLSSLLLHLQVPSDSRPGEPLALLLLCGVL